ncbi:hypothetical protein [Clostridium tertium]
MKRYLRTENNNFGFLLEGIHEIKESDKLILNEDYNLFFELQSKGKQFRLKEVPTGSELFDYIEEYTPEQLQQEQGQDEFNLDIEYRLSKLELGV